jgi:hypothetical protein
MRPSIVTEHKQLLSSILPLVRFQTYCCWGLLCVGILWGSSHAIGRIAEGPATTLMYARALAEALAIVLAMALVGSAADAACRLAVAGISARVERASRMNETLLLASQAVAAIERLAEALERRPIAETPVELPDLERAQSLSEIDQAVRSGNLADAGALIEGFDIRFPDDPAILDLRQQFEAARQAEHEGHLAEIHAARQVNDPARVLELYRAMAGSLEFDRRSELERELAGWFLEVIRRRLTGGRIQVEVVQLATQVAESFAATVPGASLRASLPTLRRSVGLCPRCAQPYVGTADACPQCLAAPAGGLAPGRAWPDDEPKPDADDPDSQPGASPGEGRDAG